MSETISPDLQLRALRLVVRAPDNYQREIRGRIRKLLLAAKDQEQAEEFISKYLDKVQQKMDHSISNRSRLSEEETTGEPNSKQHRVEE